MTIGEDIEEYFPRGGQGGEIKKKRNFVFEKKNQFEPKGKKPGRRERKKRAKHSSICDEPESDIIFERFEPLVYKGLSEGTLAFCSVREIFEKYVDISMPGRLSARLYIENVSDPYFNILNQGAQESVEGDKPSPLSSMFRVGQHVNCSVLSVKNDSHYIVRVSSNPAHVNGHMTFDMAKPGCVIQMAVQSVEDHGYMMFSGISGLVSFLPKANAISFINDICNFKPLAVGQIVWCLVTKSKLSGTSNTVQVTLDFDSITKSKLSDEVSIGLLNPGVRVDVTVNKIVSQNLLVDIKDSDIRGYIEESQLSSMFSKPEDYKIGYLHTATVLYKFPYAKLVALTLKSNPTTISKEEIKHGTIFEDAEIKAIMKRGICLQLECKRKIYKGMISVRRLGENVDYVSLSTKFPIGNHIKCRVIGFDALEQVYSCSTDDKLLNEKFLSQSDIQIGQLVDVKVETIKKSGVEVSVGAIKGYVPSQHICDVVIQNPLEKITLKSMHKAKVLNIDGSNILFTLRPTLVKTRSLTNFHSVEVGDAYYGWVNKILPSAITVSFFGGLFAHIKEENLLEHPHKYTVGELVKCYVVEIRQGKLPVFSLLKSVQKMALTVGNTYSLVVKGISKGGLTCFFISKGQNFNGFIPLSHFSDFNEFCEAEMKKYQHGSIIDKALLLSVNEKVPLFTLKQSVFDFFQNHPEMSDGFQSLKKNMLLPCSVSEVLDDRILVCAPIPGFNGKVPITAEKLLRKVASYSPYEGIVASVSEVFHNAVEVSLSCHLSDKQRLKWSIHNLENFLKYTQPLQKYRMGTKVQCKVINVQERSLNVEIDSTNLKGIIRKTSSANYKKGQTLTAVVLYHDNKENLFYLYLDNSDISIFNPLNASLLKTNVSGLVLFVNPAFIIALVSDSGVGSIVFLPIIIDPNNPKMALSPKAITPFSTCNIILKSMQEWPGERDVYFWIGKTGDFLSVTEYKKQRAKEFEKCATETEDEPQNSGCLGDIVPQEEISEVPKNKKKMKKLSNNIVELPSENALSDKGNDGSQVEIKKKKKEKLESLSETDLPSEEPKRKLKNSGEKIKKSKKSSFVVSDLPCDMDENHRSSSPQQSKSNLFLEVASGNEEAADNVNTEIKKKKKRKNKANSDSSLTLNESTEEVHDNPPPSKVLKIENKCEEEESKPEDKLRNKKSEKNKKKKKDDLSKTIVDAREIIESRKKKNVDKIPKNGASEIKDARQIIECRKKGHDDSSKSEVSENKKRKKENDCSETSVSLEDVGGFEWEATPADLARVISGTADEEQLSEDSDEETVVAKKMTPAEKRAAAYETERRVREKEEELLIAESNPQSAEHFDRLLTANPNSSKLWIMYMAHHMQATEIEKARSVAKRALKHINVRLEEERLNIWIASLNLENAYGTPDSFKEVLSDALKYNDDYKVYKRVLDIYAESQKKAELESLVHQLVKKYKSKIDCWIECQSALMKAGLHDKARNYLQRSLEALPTKDYCTLVSRFALLENKNGFPDQAQSLFENLLTSYPKRVDLWFVYVDMLTKSGNPQLARNVLERATSQTLPVRKMKALYQKWVKFEESFGTPDKVQEVKDAALNYVNNLTSSLKDV